MRVLATVLAGLMVVGGNDGDINHERRAHGAVHSAANSLPVVEARPAGVSARPTRNPLVAHAADVRGRDAGYRIRIHGLSTDGVAPPAPTPTATPTILPTPAIRSVTDIICALSWPCDQALAVARCESNLNPNAWNRIQVWMTVPGYGYVANHATGLFQMLIPLHSWRFAGADPYDAEANARAAHTLWIERGWQPWHASAHCSGVW